MLLKIMIKLFSRFAKENVYELDGMEYRGLRTAFEDEFVMAYNELNNLMEYLETNDFEPMDADQKEKFKNKKRFRQEKEEITHRFNEKLIPVSTFHKWSI